MVTFIISLGPDEFLENEITLQEFGEGDNQGSSLWSLSLFIQYSSHESNSSHRCAEDVFLLI